MTTGKLKPLQPAIDFDGYNWMSTYAPFYVDPIKECLKLGATPEEIKRDISAQVGPDRQGIAIRAEQCARHLARQMAAEMA